MRKYITVLAFSCASLVASGQKLKNTSYLNATGEKVLRLEITLPATLEESWKFFTNDQKLVTWIAPLAHIELRSGGALVTNYDSTRSLSDSSSIRLPIKSFIDQELLILKVELNDNFDPRLRETDDELQEIIQFRKIDDHHTAVISSMTGWGSGTDWDKTYDFFVRGNEWTYKQLLKNFR